MEFCQVNAVARRDDFPKTIIKQTRELPLPEFHLDDKLGRSLHDRLVQFVTQLIEAKKHAASATTEKDRTYYENKCAALDGQIDRLVYALYGLTEDEIALIEAQTSH